MILVRYRGSGSVFIFRKLLLTVFGSLLVAWQYAENGPPSILFGITLVAIAAAVRSWRSWPYLRLVGEGQAATLFARNWFSVKEVEVDARSTIHIYSSSWHGERVRTFRVDSPALKFSSRVRVSGEAEFAESDRLAEAWRRSGGHVRTERKMRW